MHAEKLYGQFCAEHMEDIKNLIRIYSDDDAIKLLKKLRDDFWSGSWEQHRKLTR
jgi:hypothetical protein